MTCTYKFNTKDGEVKLVGQPAMKAWLAVNGIDAIIAPKGGKYGANPQLVEGEGGQRAAGSAQMSGSDEQVQKGEAETVQAAVEGKHPREIADWLAENAPRADHKIVAKKVADTIRRMESEGAVFNFRVAHMGDIANAELDHSLAVTNFGIDRDRTIVADISVNGADVSDRVGVGYEPILHELVHAVTAVGLELGMTRQFANTELGEAASDLKDIREIVLHTVSERIAAGTATRFEKRLQSRQNNGMASIHEITAWSLTNSDMQKLMEGIKTGQQTVWSKFVEAVRKIIGLPPRNDTALSDVLRIAEQVMNTNLASYAKDLRYDPHLSIVEPTMNKTVGRNLTTEMRDAYNSEVRKGVRYSVKGDDRDLMITHNLTAANLMHAHKMGGIAVPSLAVVKNDSAIEGFGEITMIGSKAMADPKGYAKTQVFGADIYSPRYPSVEHDIDSKAKRAFDKQFSAMAERLGASLPDTQDIERKGVEAIDRSLPVMAQFIKDNGIEPNIVMVASTLSEERIKRLEKFGLGPYLNKASIYDLIDDPEFVKRAAAEAIDSYRATGNERMVKMADKLESDPEAQKNVARDIGYKIIFDAKQRLRPEADRYATQTALEKQIKDAGLADKFSQFAADTLDSMSKGERIFKGFSNSGKRTYTPHTLENVVNILKKELRGGENFNYGVGSLRAKFTPQFKTVEQIKKEKGRLVSKDQFEAVKKEIDAELFAVGEAISSKANMDTIIGILEDAPKIGLERAAKQYGIELSDDAKQKAAEFLTRLKHLPTEYFEAKILRDVDLSEFSGAVIPKSTPQNVRDVLAKRGVPVREYESEADRRQVVEDFTRELDAKNYDVLFSIGEKAYSIDNGKAQAEFGPVHTEFRDDAAGAVKQLMADKDGEAIVHRDDVGDISLVYGDGKMGLSHIVNRRGAGFVDRIPELLRDGTLYSKPGQKDRVFIGTDRDEAVLRFEWDGKAKTWLLSAYEKYPDLKPAGESVQESRRSQVVDERSTAPLTKDTLRQAVTRGALGQVVNSMIDAGVVVLHDNTSTLPRNVGNNVRGIQAVTMPDGKVHLVASNLSAKNANAVMLHEAFHEGAENFLGTEQWGSLMGRLGSLYRQGEQSSGKAKDFFDKARHRVAAAKAKGGVSAKMELEEFAAYAIEEYESAPASVKKWVDDLLGMIKAWLAKRFGKQFGNVTPAQLSAFAKWAVMDHAVQRRGDIFGDIGNLFSMAGSITDTPAFKRWFGDSKVVDADGNPLVVYHGTSDGGFSSFDSQAAQDSDANQGAGDDGLGFFFTDDRKLAEQHRDRLDGERPAWMPATKQVYEVYLSLKKPFITSYNVTAERRAELEHQGYDGVIYDFGGWKEYVAFRPEQIKSATGNNGEFNPSNPDIRYSTASANTDSPSFKRWFGKSEIVDANGQPRVMYHGSAEQINVFKGSKYRGDTISFTADPDVAREYASGAVFVKQEDARKAGTTTDAKVTLHPVYLRVEKLFDGSNPAHRDAVAAELEKAGEVAPSYYKTWDATLKSEEDDVLEQGNVIAAMKAAGFDGQRVFDTGIGKSIINVFSPNQIKSIDNNGDFDPSNPDIRYSLTDDMRTTTAPAAPQEPNRYTPPEQGPARRLQAAVQDNMNRVTQVQDKIKELTGRTTLGKADYRAAEVNRPGRIAARLEDFREGKLQPLVQRIAKAGYTIDQVEQLAHAMHADERNKANARINPKVDPASAEYEGTQGSGMNDDVADGILKLYKGDRKLHAFVQEVRDIAKETLDLKLSYGLMKPEDYELLTKQYKYYIPLKGDAEYGPKIKRSAGHETRDEHILENIARDYEQSVVVGEKNLARQSLLRMVLKFPDAELWTASAPPKGRYVAGKSYSVQRNGKSEAVFTSMPQVNAFLEAKGAEAASYQVLDSAGERVVEFTKPLQDNEVMVYVNGDPVRIQIHDEKLATQLRPLNQAQMGPILEQFRKVNRYLSSIYTGYNPAFILRNATRDAITGTINMLGNEGAAVAAKAWGKYPAAVAALGQWATTKKAPDTKAGRYLTEYRMHGGKTGASYMSDLERQGENLQFMYDKTRGLVATAKEGNVKRTAAVAWNKTVGRLAHVVEIANQATENGLRLGLYMALREEGVSADKAAQAAKSVTVDFDRKGASTGALGAIYLFFNPAVQGTANAMKTLMHGQHKGQAWAALGGLVAAGFLAASKGMDEDKDKWLGEGWETRTKNLIINTPGHQFRAPMSQEFAPAYAFGVAMAEAARGESKVRTAARIVSSFIDAYFPLQGAYKEDSDNHLADAAQAATPTVLKPLIESAMNRNSFGSQVVPESELTKDKPDNLKMNRGTKNTAYDKAAQGIAAAGESIFGVGKYENDITKVSPETLKSLWRTYTGGLGQFITDSAGVAAMGGRDISQIEASDVPIIKDFYRQSTVGPIRSRYYDLSKEAKAAITEFEQAKKVGDGAELSNIIGGEKGKLVGLGKMVRSVSKAAAALGDEKVAVNASTTLNDSEKRAELKRIEKEEEELYRSGIEAFK